MCGEDTVWAAWATPARFPSCLTVASHFITLPPGVLMFEVGLVAEAPRVRLGEAGEAVTAC